MIFGRLFPKKDLQNPLPPAQPSGRKIGELNQEGIRELFALCADVKTVNVFLNHTHEVQLAYCEGLVDYKQINEVVYPRLHEAFENGEISHPAELKHGCLPLQIISENTQVEEIMTRIFSGDLLLFFHHAAQIYSMNISQFPQRKPEDSNTETSIRGARDGFTEELPVNVALIRKRLRTNKLCYEPFELGKNTKKKIGLLYLQGVINDRLVEEMKSRLNQIGEKDLLSSTQVEEVLNDYRFTVFPLFSYTGRPDFAANCLLRGRMVIIVDGEPTVIIAPVHLTFLLNTPEDVNTSILFVAFTRMLRLVGFGLSLFLPGFWIALVTYHQDQLPYTLVATLVLSRQGVPFPTALECILMLFLFEVFREAGARLPLAIGQTLSVVGGLIVGDAAISAGLTAPGILVAVAISVVSTFTLINQNLVAAVSVLRILIVIVSSLLGMFGFLVCVLAMVLYMVNLKSFDIPYLSPISPPDRRDIFKVLIRLPWKKSKEDSPH